MEIVQVNSIKAWLLAARPKTLAGAATPVLLGCALAYADSCFQMTPALLCFAFAFLMQIDANFINDYFDYLKGSDREDRLGPERACAQGWITLNAMRKGIALTTATACLAGLCLLAYGGIEMIPVGILCKMKIRVGFGFDVHQLVTGRELWLGGIKFEHELGLLGHSDADVLIHAICDALLGAANMRDIGYHFPDTAGEFKNIDSKILLAETVDLIAAKGYKVGNVDATICAERPKLKARIPEMQLVLAHLMRIDVDDVSVKATTTEKLGFTGREEGISAYATVLIEKAE